MRINDIDIKQLRYFIAVAEELSFTRAAIKLHMSQPPLTQHIIALEHHLGVTLLNRTKRHVSLTPAGNVFLNEAKKILKQIEESASITRGYDSGIKGYIKIGVNYSSPLHSLTNKILQGFKKENPDMEITVSLNDTGNITDKMDFDKSELDFMFAWIDSRLLSKSCDQRILSRDKFKLVVSKESKLARKSKITLEDLEDFPIILKHPSDGTNYYQSIDSIFSKNNKMLNEHQLFMVKQLSVMVSMVAANQGIAFIPEFIKCLGLEGVVWKDFEEVNGYTFDYTCIFPKKSSNPVRKIFLSWLENNI